MASLAGKAQSTVPPALDQYVERVLDSFQVPGLSIGIVKDGEVVLAKGYGVRKLGEQAKVDENTLFCIASNSKAFTATALAILIDEGKLKWEDKVIDYLPWFRMSDDYVTTHLTVRDLLVHHSGLPAYVNDLLLFPPSTFTRKELIAKLKDVKLAYDFRTAYAYDNILYIVAGEIVKSVSGQEWEDFVQEKIFQKVGMNSSISRFSDLSSQPNFAYSHRKKEGKLQVVENFRDIIIGDQGNAAGGIASSALDMSKWMIAQLDSGRTVGGRRLFAAKATDELWKMVRPMPIAKEPEWLEPAQKDFLGYALGFRTTNYRDKKMLYHGGLLTGFVSQVAMVPNLNLGIVVLTNQLSTGAYWSIINHILDYYMGAHSFDWIGGYKRELDSASARASRNAHKLVYPDSSVKQVLALDECVGMYRDALAGEAVIQKHETGYRLQFVHMPMYEAAILPFRGDSHLLRFVHPNMGDDAYLHFVLNADKSIQRLLIEAPGDGDFNGLELFPVKQAILDSVALRKKIEGLMEKHPKGRFAVAFKDLTTGETFLHDAHKNFHAASTMKTPVMVEVFRQASLGKFSVDDSILVYNRFKSIVDGSYYSQDSINDSEHDLYKKVGTKLPISDLLYRMITKSSNLATNIVIDLVGAKNVNKTMRAMGAKDIQVLRGVEDSKAYEKGLNNTTTAYDLMLLFEQLAEENIIDKASCDRMIEILMDQHFRSKIPALLPEGVRTATKTGSLATVSHDSGVVFLPDGRKYVVVLLSDGIDKEEADKTLAQISRALYDYTQSGLLCR
ncbi:serine hydrolase [Olivibacter sitiensis]|uniref:serine hydrolase n=1 Tax=Olivibacter sitiensis TaxID=376470 RepID=UPI001FE232DF|nr:serine hydrolase [Olivibacter sitiensis]